MATFCETNVHWDKDKTLLQTKFETAVRLGFDSIIINYTIGQEALKSKKEKNKANDTSIPEASSIKVSDEFIQSLSKKYGRNIAQYTRLTTIIEDASQTHKLQNDKVILGYQVYAIQPTTEKTFQLACQTLDIDIISLDFTQRLPFYFKRTFVGVAVERGIHFEVTYSPAIRDQTARRHTISNFLNLNRVCKGKNILLASGCRKAIEIRSPYDVANLGLLFGLTEAQSKSTVSTNCRALLLHTKSRRVTGTVISITDVDKLPQGEKWKLSANHNRESSSDSEGDSSSDDNSDSLSGNVKLNPSEATDDYGPPAAKKIKT